MSVASLKRKLNNAGMVFFNFGPANAAQFTTAGAYIGRVPARMRITGVYEKHTTAATANTTWRLYRESGTTAIGSSTAVTSATALDGAADTEVSATINPANCVAQAGEYLGAIPNQTPTSLVGMGITIVGQLVP